jgi:archaellin
MNNNGISAVTPVILLVSFILIGSTVASVMSDSSSDVSEQDLEEMVDEIVKEVSTYLKIEDIMGKYYTSEDGAKIQRIVIMIKPLFSVDINVSELMIKISNGESVKILYYGGKSVFIQENSLFDHYLWDDTTNNNYNLIVLLDTDRSIIDFDVINDNTDFMYIIINLPDDFQMKKNQSMTLSIFLANGITRSVNLKAPLPMKNVVSLL